jgi:hypothetical protein
MCTGSEALSSYCLCTVVSTSKGLGHCTSVCILHVLFVWVDNRTASLQLYAMVLALA